VVLYEIVIGTLCSINRGKYLISQISEETKYCQHKRRQGKKKFYLRKRLGLITIKEKLPLLLLVILIIIIIIIIIIIGYYLPKFGENNLISTYVF